MIQYFKNINQQTVQVTVPENDTWINISPPLKQEEFLHSESHYWLEWRFME